MSKVWGIFILIILLVTAYFVDLESGSQKSLNLHLQELKLGEYHFELDSDNNIQEELTSLKIPSNAFTHWIEKLNSLKIIAEYEQLPEEQNTLVRFKFELNKEVLKIYNVNEVTGNFFVTKGDSVFLCEATDSYTGVYVDEVDKKKRAYLEFEREINNYKTLFFRSSFLKGKIQKFQREGIAGAQMISFDFLNLKTFPAYELPLVLSVKSLKRLEQSLGNVQILEVKRHEPLPAKAQSVIYFESSKEKKSFLYTYFQGKNFLLDEQNDLLFMVDNNFSQNLFLPVEQMWEGKVLGSTLEVGKDYRLLDNKKRELIVEFDKEGEVYGVNKLLKKQEQRFLKEVFCYLSACHSSYKFYKVDKGVLKSSAKFTGMDSEVFLDFDQQFMRAQNSQYKMIFSYVFPNQFGKKMMNEIFE